MTLKKSFFYFGLISIALILSFQNCGDVRVKQFEAITMASSNMDAVFCAENVTSFMVLNLTSKMVNGSLEADSDIDGLSDSEELSSSDPAFDPLNRTTYGQLDGTCLQQGGVNCTSPSVFTPDADDDGIPDFIEALKGTSINIKDSLVDFDFDGMNNIDEIKSGRSPISDTDAEAGDDKTLSASFYINSDLAAQCPGKRAYSVAINRIPLLATKTVTTSQNPDFNHGENENLIAIYYISKPDNPANGRNQLYSLFFKIPLSSPIGFSFQPSDFKLEGEF